MNTTNPRFKDQDPWDVWHLTPYVPDPRPAVVVNDELVRAGFREPTGYTAQPRVISVEPINGFALCDYQMTATSKQERGKYGRRSASTHLYPCQRRAIQSAHYDNGSSTNRCKEHRLG